MKELGSYLFETSRKSPLPPFTRHQDFLLLYIYKGKEKTFLILLYALWISCFQKLFED